MEAALEAGAEDFRREEDQYVVTTEPADLHAVRAALQARGMETSEAQITWVPKTTVRVEGADAQQLMKLLEALEELDDVQKVEGNFDIDADALAEA
jgi:transcriptional/translational regulatory protein YebC/TACO1